MIGTYVGYGSMIYHMLKLLYVHMAILYGDNNMGGQARKLGLLRQYDIPIGRSLHLHPGALNHNIIIRTLPHHRPINR